MYLVTNGRLITRDPDGKGYYEHGAVAYEGSRIVEVGEESALRALSDPEALKTAPFTLGPVTLSFHFEARALYPEHASLLRVSIPYADVREMMTDFGRRETDNSMYKMVALTFDDGPSAHTARIPPTPPPPRC